MIAVELCSGAGGLSRGLLEAGVHVVVAVDRDRHCGSTYQANFPETDFLLQEISEVTGELLLRRMGIRKDELGALVAGLPCQGFSESNRRTRTASNPKNQLYRRLLQILPALNPRWILLENVAGLATLESGRFLERMVADFKAVGYRLRHKILDARDFGVPQRRKRLFIVGDRMEKRFFFPTPEGDSRVTVRDAIEDLPVLENGAMIEELAYRSPWLRARGYAKELRCSAASAVSGNQVSRNSPRVLERYRHIGMGENWQSIPVELMSSYKSLGSCHTGIYYRLEWDAEAKVIGNFRKNMLVHPSQDRGLSVREAARLQSFPDLHTFIGPLNDRQKQVGNAVPPRLAKAVGLALLEADGR